VSTYRFGPGQHVITWKPPAGLAQGAYPVQVSAVSYAGNRGTTALTPLVVHWETAPPPVEATFDGTTLTWSASDPGTPWLALALDLFDPSGVQPPQTLDLGRQGLQGTTVATLPAGTWQVTLRATNSAGLTTTKPLGTFTPPG
jgi:predicted phage tail protein